ncbi:MAG: diacylglycerol kinase [Porticoccaceae bacterium]
MSGLLRRRLVNALGYSLRGLRACYRYEEAFRVEVALAVVLVPLGLWLGDGAVEKALLVGSVMMVMIVELLNSAVEAAIDRIGLEHAELSGRAKDLGSAAVFMSMWLVALVWGLLLFERSVFG